MTSLNLFKWNAPFSFELGGELPSFQIAYETWGELNSEKSNAILLFTGLSASCHAKSHTREDRPGWWEAMIGPRLALDTNRFFVICANYIGGCFGSTGPASIDPATGRPFGPNFPPVLCQDLAKSVNLLIEDLGISRLRCTLGASMGGMMAMEFAARYPTKVERMIMISGSGRPGALSIAFRFVQRQVILSHPDFNGGDYYRHPEKLVPALAVARQIGNITYRSGPEFNQRFGRSRIPRAYSLEPEFQIESYLKHMGDKLAIDFDPNTFLLLTKAMDLYSLGYGFPSYEEGVARIQAKCLIIGVSSDMLFPYEEQESVHLILEQLGRDSRFILLQSHAGHDAFLVEVDFFSSEIRDFLLG